MKLILFSFLFYYFTAQASLRTSFYVPFPLLVTQGGTGQTTVGTNGQILFSTGGTSTTWGNQASAAVTSVFGRTGAVTATFTDIGGTASTAQIPVIAGNTTGIIKAPTMTFLSGSGTYNPPTSPSPIWIEAHIFAPGGGGGASGSGGTSGNNGTAGGISIFGGGGGLSSNGGQGGAIYNQGGGGPGGTSSLGTFSGMGRAYQGGDGQSGFDATVATSDFAGGNGGSGCLGGNGSGMPSGGSAGKALTGGGGGGAGIAGLANTPGGGGGGAGGCSWARITGSALATIISSGAVYAIGTAGTGGPAAINGFAGGNGATGDGYVIEGYQ